MQEIWTDVVGYDGLYQVSNYGNIKRFKRYSQSKLTKPKKNKDGYW